MSDRSGTIGSPEARMAQFKTSLIGVNTMARKTAKKSKTSKTSKQSIKATKVARKAPATKAPARKTSAKKTVAKRVTAKAVKRRRIVSKSTSPSPKAAQPVLLSGGNPQIAKGYGDAPVQAYIDAMPGWKSDVGRRIDAIIARTVPNVRKAVKWNSPLYGVEDESQGWFLGVHVFAKYVKVAFFRGASLQPIPPGESRQEYVRYLDIREDEPLDEAQFAAWVKQASQLPGERM